MKLFSTTHNRLKHSLLCGALFIFSASAQAVVFQAENYSAYNDTTPGNSGGAYHNDNVDIQATSDAGGGYNIGWIAANEWWAYNSLNIPSTGSYTIRIRVASPNGAIASVDLNAGTIQLGDFAIPTTGGWQNWTTVTRTVNLNAGTYNLGVFAKTADWNFNWIEVVANGAPNPTWSDEFNSINSATWTNETGGGGWGNSEREYYTAGQNTSIQYDAAAGSNVLVIEARKENPANYSCWYGRCEYTSARMVSKDKKTFKYGRIEARLKLPQTQGIWPAFWLLGNNIGQGVDWPACGEIDIMEHVGFEPVITHGAIHGPGYSGNTPFIGANYLPEAVNANYHVYSIEWNATSINWFVDGKKFYGVTKQQVQTYGNWVYDNPMFILLNVAVGGQWPGNPDGSSTFPQRMYVDYIRVYQ
ncbi:MAG: family 16 glycosylhydrolase [Pseudomonadota bacterium]